MNLEFFAERQDMGRTIALYVGANTGASRYAVKPVVFVTAEEGVLTPPAMRLSIDAGQKLMDELWRAGLRPSEGTGSAGALAATERHLRDMQKIAFSVLESRPSAAGGPQP